MNSSSLHKTTRSSQKQNSNRLSNTKNNNSKGNYSGFITPVYSIDDKVATKRSNKMKSVRKNQMSCEQILQVYKTKQPFAYRGSQEATKKLVRRRKKKEGLSNACSQFELQAPPDFSRSNSLIVFSEKDTTLNNTATNRYKQFYLNQLTMGESQAATIIQKHWRGYQTRRLLDQYIRSEQQRFEKALSNSNMQKEITTNSNKFSKLKELQNSNKLKQFSLIDQKEDYQSMFSSISEQPNQCNQRIDPFESNQHSNTNILDETPIINIDLNKHQSQILKLTDLADNSKIKKQLSIESLVYCLRIEGEELQKRQKGDVDEVNEVDADESIHLYISKLGQTIDEKTKQTKTILKDQLVNNQMAFEQMIEKSKNLKQVQQSCQTFLSNVQKELLFYLKQLTSSPSQQALTSSKKITKASPKSQIYTVDVNVTQSPQKDRSQSQLRLLEYLLQLQQNRLCNYPEHSQLEFLCEHLRYRSQQGVKNIYERCLLQFTVDIITENYQLDSIVQTLEDKNFNTLPQHPSREQSSIIKWILELRKWELGTIQEVTQYMESSSFIAGDTTKLLITE